MKSSNEMALKQAVEEQLDLILKIQEDRKILRRQNKLLTQKYQSLANIMKKYHVEKEERAVNTQEQDQFKDKIFKQSSVQVDLEPIMSTHNTSKLSSAQQLLKVMEMQQKFNTSQVMCTKCEERSNNTILTNEQIKKKSTPSTQQNQQISNQIVKMAKEISNLKKELKDYDSKSKAKDKELKELKKCLETKSQILEKTRKQFNQLSLLLNNDKLKSVRNLESEAQQLRIKVTKLEDQIKMMPEMKQMLEEITAEYESYRSQKEMKIQKLMIQLKQKDELCSELYSQTQVYKQRQLHL